MTNMHNYSINKQKAIAEMLDMNKRAKKFHTQQSNVFDSALLSLDSDTLVILALMYILYSDKSDMLLVFALAYILF